MKIYPESNLRKEKVLPSSSLDAQVVCCSLGFLMGGRDEG